MAKNVGKNKGRSPRARAAAEKPRGRGA
jgi:hypothetical protein